MFGLRRPAVDRTDEIMRRYLDGDFQCYASHDEAPTAKELRSVAAKRRCRLPDEFLAHATGRLGGVYIEANEEVWPRAEVYDVAPFWTFFYGLFVYGLSPQIPDWMNIELCSAEFEKSTARSLVPCLKVMGKADIYLFNESGRVVQWHHETDELEPVDLAFFDLFEREVRELRAHKDRKKALA